MVTITASRPASSSLAAAAVRTVPLEVDEHGARVPESATVRNVLLAPAHQFPTGVPLHPERRAAVVDRARARDGLIVEDDYDGEFRYDREPVGAVQGLDPERVVHLGSVSKSLSPAVRLGWMVLPEHLVAAVLAAKGAPRPAWASVLDRSLAEFIASATTPPRPPDAPALPRAPDRLVTVLAEHAPQVAPSASPPACTRYCACRRAPSGGRWKPLPTRASPSTASPPYGTRTRTTGCRRPRHRLRRPAGARLRRGPGGTLSACCRRPSGGVRRRAAVPRPVRRR